MKTLATVQEYHYMRTRVRLNITREQAIMLGAQCTNAFKAFAEASKGLAKAARNFAQAFKSN